MTKEEKDLREWERFLDLERKYIKLKMRMMENNNYYYFRGKKK